jgi:hypothetical protein
LHKRHTSWNSVAKITQFQESRTGCILGPFKKLISDHRHKQAQAQASTSELDFIKASSDRVPITSDRVWRIAAKG